LTSEDIINSHLYKEFLKYLEWFICCHKNGSLQAIQQLGSDEDLKKYNALSEPDVQDLLNKHK